MPLTNTSLRNPAPPGLGHDDPLYKILQQRLGLEGPFLRDYYQMGLDIRKEGPDLWEKGDGLRKQKWLEGIRRHVMWKKSQERLGK